MNRLQANMVLLFVSIIWGTTFVVQQVATGNLGAISFTSARFFMGALIVLPFAFIQLQHRQKNQGNIKPADWIGMVLTGIVLFSGAVLQQAGIFHTTVANAGFLTALYVPMVPIFAFFILNKHIHWVVWPSSIGSLVGTYIMSGANNLSINAGDVWVIAGAFFWAVHVILVGTMAKRTQAPLVVAVVQFFVCAIVALVAGFFLEHPKISDFFGAYPGILYAGILSVGFAFTLQVVAQRYTLEADAAIILSAEIVFAALAGFVFLGERLSQGQMVGAAIILCCILTVQLVPVYKKKKFSE
ncbi:MAG: DMT family transporter [Pseudomonadota bacterium]